MIEINKKAIKLFFAIVVPISAILEGLTIYTGNTAILLLLMWTPAMAAIIAKLVYFRKEKHALLFSKCKLKYLGLGMLYPLIYLGLPYVIYWIINPGSMQINWGIQTLLTAIVGTVISLMSALGEEIGWRGFLVPRLETVIGTDKTLFLTGLIWGIWHCPILLSGIYMPGTPIAFKLPLFLLIICASGVIFGILTLRSKSVWPAALLHAAHNNYDQTILNPGTLGESKMYFVSETGIFTAIVTVALAALLYYFFKREQKKVE